LMGERDCRELKKGLSEEIEVGGVERNWEDES
jgi:hypothetical protein